ncbi:MAG: hypothetical protein ACLTS6_15555 [Anaerobutyricum sp.]
MVNSGISTITKMEKESLDVFIVHDSYPDFAFGLDRDPLQQ